MIAVVPLTRSVVKNPIHVALSPAETGLDSSFTALIDRSRLRKSVVGRVTLSAQIRIDRGLVKVCGLG